MRHYGRNSIPHAAILLIAGSVLTGCAAPPTSVDPTTATLRLTDRPAFVDQTLSLLRAHHFPPDRVVANGREITTERVTSGQWFEPWRRDVHGGYQTLEANVHTIGRVVRLELEPVAPAAAVSSESERTPGADAPDAAPVPAPDGAVGRYRLSVSVDKYRFSAPARQVTTASGALALYDASVPTVAGERAPLRTQVRWLPIGRDPLLEQYLLAQIMELPSVAAAAPEAE